MIHMIHTILGSIYKELSACNANLAFIFAIYKLITFLKKIDFGFLIQINLCILKSPNESSYDLLLLLLLKNY